MSRLFRHLLLPVMMILMPLAAHTAGIETLLMPGKVTTAHAKIESECTQCHVRNGTGTQETRCLACHKPVAEDIANARGFHGRLPQVAKVQCVACHTEHKGREADIVKWMPEYFDHAQTDFPLRDAHASVACTGCHKTSSKVKTLRDTPTSCVECHKRDEPHQGQLGTDCAACHGSSTWLTAKFDHGKTRFALSGKHTQLQCASCHAGNRYKKTPLACVSCHAPDDVHRGSRGTQCDQCHAAQSWTTARFDHAKETGFALLGAHAHADCTACHTTGRMQDPIPKDCAGCHQAQDAHAGRFGRKCSTCHATVSWQSSFDHSRDTHFVLEGPHAKLECDTCHSANVAEQKLGSTCVGCHRAQDVHTGKLGAQCEQCHVVAGWSKDIHFDHDLTEFPLLGLHTVVACEQCHLSRQYKGTARNCIGCHQQDDRHHGNLGKDCASCHSLNGWNLWKFDHQKQTGFALSGAHTSLQCPDCHRKPAGEVKLSPDCVSCHQHDDIHAGQFGRQCQRCHGTTTFRGGRAR